MEIAYRTREALPETSYLLVSWNTPEKRKRTENTPALLGREYFYERAGLGEPKNA